MGADGLADAHREMAVNLYGEWGAVGDRYNGVLTTGAACCHQDAEEECCFSRHLLQEYAVVLKSG